MKKSIGTLAVAAAVFAAPCAMAQEGMWEISVAGNIENSSSTFKSGGFSSTSDTTNTFVTLNVGRYFTPQLVGRVDMSVFGTDSGNSSSVGSAVGIGVKYYLGEAAKMQWVPFVNAGVSVVGQSSKSGGTTTTYSGAGMSGGVGVSYFITEEVSGDLSLQGFYNTLTDSTVDLTQSGTRLLFGLTARY